MARKTKTAAAEAAAEKPGTAEALPGGGAVPPAARERAGDGDIENILEARSQAVAWINARLRTGVDDWREVDGLLRALDRAREISRARLEAEESEARAKAAALGSEARGARESVQIAFEGWAEEAAK